MDRHHTGGVRSKALKSSSGIDSPSSSSAQKERSGSSRGYGYACSRGRRHAASYWRLRHPRDTVASLDDLFEAGILPSTAELLDRTAVEALSAGNPPRLAGRRGGAFIEVEGTPEHVASSVRYVDGIVRRRATTTKFAEAEAEIAKLWAARSGLAAASALMHPDKHRIFAGEDLAVPLSEIPHTIRRAREISAELHIAVIFYGHFGDGNVHSAILIDPSDPDEVRRADELADRLHRLAIDRWHGPPESTARRRAPALHACRARDAARLMRRVKAALDRRGSSTRARSIR